MGFKVVFETVEFGEVEKRPLWPIVRKMLYCCLWLNECAGRL